MIRTLQSLGEHAAIDRLTRCLGLRSDVVMGPGDDCAVVRPPLRTRYDLLLKSDPVIEGIHFQPGTPPPAIGHKAAGRVLSDIAAMGGTPLWLLVNLVAPPQTRVSTLDGIYRGIRRLSTRHGVAVVGGDLSRGPTLEVHVFAVGQVPVNAAIPRSEAKAGDLIYVTGTLGGSILGKHLSFQPRIEEGRFLLSRATAMIDLSDGLATDLRHIVTASRCGAQLEEAALPVAQAARRLRNNRSPAEHALTDGEDFELLFTVRAAREKALVAAWRKKFKTPCTRIGIITNRQNIIELTDANGRRHPLRSSGFEHFKK